jgi:hypothetical protein
MNKVINKAKEKYFKHQQTYALCHYVIKNNKVKRKTSNMSCTFFLLDRFIENVMVNMLDLKCFQMRFYYHFLEK